jgi:hypothetical protein
MKAYEFGLKFFFTKQTHKTGMDSEAWELSAERKQALINSGIWQNPAAREAAILGYMKYDLTKDSK